MRTNLEQARHLMESQGYTCVLYKAGRVYTSDQRGVRPLLNWLESGADVRGYSAADKVVGKATALLYCLLGVREVYAGVISRAAELVLLGHGVPVLYSQRVDFIFNRSRTGQCPMEAATKDIDDPEAGLAAIRQALKRL